MFERNCTFHDVVGTDCGSDSKDRSNSTTLLPLTECVRDISSHKSQFAFHGLDTEIELILARCGIFEPPANIVSWVICSKHRATLGVSWKRASRKCCVPGILSKHSPRVAKRPVAERGLSKDGSILVYKETGIFLPVGTGILLFVSITRFGDFFNS